MTGQIKECSRRNIKVDEYIKCNKLKPDINILIRDNEEKEINIEDIPLDVREKCFIEQNRIQAFALLDSKQTGERQKDILATLIGLEDLQDFIDSFVKPNSFKLEYSTKYQNDYNEALKEKSDIEIAIKAFEDVSLQDLYNELDKVLKKDDNSCYLYSYKIKLLDEGIRKAENELSQLQRTFYFIDEKEYNALVAEVRKLFEEYREKEREYRQQKERISFRNLYKAVIDLKGKISSEKCPLCETNILKTAVNPFEKAEKELKNLEDIAKLESSMKELQTSLQSVKYYERLREFNEKILDNIEGLNWHFKTIPFDRNMFSVDDKIKAIESFLEIYDKNKEFFTEYFSKSNIEKIQYDDLKPKLEAIKQSIDSLKKEKNDLERTWEIKKQKEKTIKEKNEKLSEIGKSIVAYKKNADNEAEYNKFLDEIEASYREFYSDLISFKKKIERETIENTEKDIVNYYKLINKGDNECEQINDINIVIPEKDTEKYEIIIKKDNKEASAIQHLSEGHLRALGFSIILAIAKKNNVPFIIFDDVVNAIDLEHRANLIDIFFNDDFLKEKQLIVTTHDRLFWERFCNEYGKRIDKESQSHISFILRYTQMGVLCDQYGIGLLQKIEEAINHYDIRQALNYCRILLETQVIEYCIRNKKELTAIFDQRAKTSGNLLRVSLDKIYSAFEMDTNIKNNLGYKKLKKDPIIWQLLNQEHHAFDENNLNAIHAKTSAEIREVYEALVDFYSFLETYTPSPAFPTSQT